MRKILVLLLVLYVKGVGYAQSFDPLTRYVTPEQYSLIKSVEHPANNFTGIPQISIPLHTLEAGTITIPIRLDYNASGIKVDEFSGPAGLGWRLHAGGEIVRIVRGVPDDFLSEDHLGVEGRNFAHDKAYAKHDRNSEMNNILYAYLGSNRSLSNCWDFQPDLYKFSFGEYAGAFSINGKGEVVLLPYSNLKIRRVRSGFEITDPQGNVFFFEDSNLIYILGEDGDAAYVSSWVLKQVSSPVTGDSVYFDYDEYDLDQSFSLPNSQNPAVLGVVDKVRLPVYSNVSQVSCPVYPSEGLGYIESRLRDLLGKYIYDPVRNTFSINMVSRVYRLKKIRYRGTSIDFYHSDRVSDGGYYRVDSLSVSFDGKRRKAAGLNYSFRWGRMFLESLTVNNERYGFGYSGSYNGRGLPQRLSRAQDRWGYYNGEDLYDDLYSSKDTFGPHNRLSRNNADENYARIGSLNRIAYPAGGWTEYQLEGNTLSNRGNKPLWDDMGMIADSAYYLTQQYIQRDDFYFVDYYDFDTEAFLEFAVHGDSKNVRFRYIVTPVNFVGIDESYVGGCLQQLRYAAQMHEYEGKTFRLEGKLSLEAYNPATESWDAVQEQPFEPQPLSAFDLGGDLVELGNLVIHQGEFRVDNLKEGRYRLTLQGNTPYYSCYLYGSSMLNFPLEKGTDVKYGGLRVKSVKSYDRDGKTVKEKRYDYTSSDGGSSGTYDGTSQNVDFPFYHNYNYQTVIEENLVNAEVLQCYIDYTINSLCTASDGVGPDFGYSDVAIEYLRDGVPEGKEEYRYTTGLTPVDADEKILPAESTFILSRDTQDVIERDVSSFSCRNYNYCSSYQELKLFDGMLFTRNRRVLSNGWKRGHLKGKKVFDAGGRLIQREAYVLGCIYPEAEPSIGYHIYPVEGKLGGGVGLLNFFFDYFSFDVSGYVRTLSDTVYEYKPQGTVVKSRKYTYNTNGLTSTVEETSSQNTPVASRYYYSSEVGTAAFEESRYFPASDQALYLRYNPTIPVQTERYVNGKLKDKQRTTVVGHRSISLPKERLAWNGTSLYPYSWVTRYDSDGNPLEVVTKNDTTSYLYGYQNEVPVVAAQNVVYERLSRDASEILQRLNASPIDTLLKKVGSLAYKPQEQLWQTFNAELRERYKNSPGLVRMLTVSPLIGVESTVDEKGILTKYRYDGYGRLTGKADGRDRLLESYLYRYYYEDGYGRLLRAGSRSAFAPDSSAFAASAELNTTSAGRAGTDETARQAGGAGVYVVNAALNGEPSILYPNNSLGKGQAAEIGTAKINLKGDWRVYVEGNFYVTNLTGGKITSGYGPATVRVMQAGPVSRDFGFAGKITFIGSPFSEFTCTIQ